MTDVEKLFCFLIVYFMKKIHMQKKDKCLLKIRTCDMSVNRILSRFSLILFLFCRPSLLSFRLRYHGLKMWKVL